MQEKNCSLDEVMNELNKNSGFLGLSGKSSDFRDIYEGVENNDEKCILAFNKYVETVVKYIAEYYVELGGCDGIVFTAGIGENSVSTRAEIIKKLECLGVELDTEANTVRGVERCITKETSKIPCYIIPTDEEVMIARDTYEFLK